jgi:diguanylate cyclase (GGDEF)-like protein
MASHCSTSAEQQDETAPAARYHPPSDSLLSTGELMIRLLLAFTILVGLLIAVGHLGLSRMDAINANFDAILVHRWTTLQLAREALSYSSRNSRITMQIFLTRDQKAIASLLAARAENTKIISALVAKLKRRCDSAEEKQLLTAVEAARDPYILSYLRSLHLLLDERKPAAASQTMTQETTPALLKYHGAWDEFLQYEMHQVETEAEQSRARYAHTRRMALFMIATAVALAVGIGAFVIRKITVETRTRTQAEHALQQLNGELEQRVEQRTLQLQDVNRQLLSEARERESAEKQVQFLAYYDALTGLPNRTLLRDRMTVALASARRRAEKLAVLFLDLDKFKNVNDSLGHSVGDTLLKEVAARLKAHTREQDTVARLGGDEFIVLLTAIGTAADAAITATRMISDIARGFTIQGYELDVSCSVGISVFPDHATDVDALVKNADAAMYSAKNNGCNNFQFFTADMNTMALEKLTLENGLRHALERKEMFLMYQPQVDMFSGAVVGAEALLRWRHADLGLVPPDKFIPVAESSGLILPIGEWVLRTACGQARQWQNQGLRDLPISVNVSPLQFRQKGFARFVKNVLGETGLAPQSLELELTEGLILSSAELVITVLRELRDMGIKLSIDDFGTGYSNLSYLRQFPVYKLKIDRSFVKDVTENPDDAAITGTIISMARNLNLKVIAEGVETEAQMTFLRAHHCDEFQGYYFSKPLTTDEFAASLARSVSRSSA